MDPPQGTVQHTTRDLRDAAKTGPVLEATLDYRADGVYLVGVKVSATILLFTDTETLQPPSPVLFLPTGAKPGYHTELDVPTSAGNAHITIDELRQEKVTVAGQSVDTTVVRLGATITGQLNADLSLTVWLAPANRLWVKEQFRANVSTLNYQSQYDATLQRLTPD